MLISYLFLVLSVWCRDLCSFLIINETMSRSVSLERESENLSQENMETLDTVNSSSPLAERVGYAGADANNPSKRKRRETGSVDFTNFEKMSSDERQFAMFEKLTRIEASQNEMRSMQSRLNQTCNQNDIDPTCQVCSSSPETLLHFILECPILETIRNPIISDITFEYAKLNFTTNSFEDLSADKQLQIIMDCTVLFDTVNQNKKRVKNFEKLQQLEYQTRRLLHNLHCARYRMVKEIPSRRR